jgi:hypothetical protein
MLSRHVPPTSLAFVNGEIDAGARFSVSAME